MPKFVVPVDLSKNEIQNARIQNLSSDPSSPVEGQIYYNTSTHMARIYNGTTFVELGDVQNVAGTAPIVATANGNDWTISINAASGSSAGSMSASHYTLVNGATSANTASTLVQRDASGNFSAGTITANLTGTASNASQLNSQNPSYYLDRANHTGTQTASTISDFDTQVRTSRLDQMAAPTASVSLNSQKITGLADPVDAQDAATKAYVDAARSGLDVKASVRAATTENIDLTGEQTIDGVSVVAGNRVLVKNQSTASENGIYVASASGWSRSSDADSNAEVTAGMFTFVEEGTTNADSGWVLTTNNPITVGSTSLAFAQFSGAGQIVAGDGLTKTGSTLNVGAGTGITVNADSVQISATYTGQSSITTLGTISTGTWNGSTITVAYGGTGATTFTSNGVLLGNGTDAVSATAAGTADQVLRIPGAGGAPAFGAIDLTKTAAVTGALPLTNGGTGATSAADARTNLNVPSRYAVSIGDGSATTITVTHNLGTRDVVVSVYDSATYAEVIADVVHATTNTVTITFSVAPASNAYRCVVIG